MILWHKAAGSSDSQENARQRKCYPQNVLTRDIHTNRIYPESADSSASVKNGTRTHGSRWVFLITDKELHMMRSVGRGTRQPWVQTLALTLPRVRSWAHYFSPLSLGFLICIMGIMIPPGEDETRDCKLLYILTPSIKDMVIF